MRLFLASSILLATAQFGCSSPQSSGPERHVPATIAKEQIAEAVGLMGSGKLEEALRMADAAITSDPAFSGARLYKGFILSRLGHETEAQEAFTKAVALDPFNCESPLFLGLALEQAGNMEQARAHYVRSAECFAESVAASSNPKPEYRVYEAVARYLHRGKLEGLQTISDVLTDYPDFPPAIRVHARFVDDDREYFYRWVRAPDL